jgi:hypothetical protein
LKDVKENRCWADFTYFKSNLLFLYDDIKTVQKSFGSAPIGRLSEAGKTTARDDGHCPSFHRNFTSISDIKGKLLSRSEPVTPIILIENRFKKLDPSLTQGRTGASCSISKGNR